MSLLWVEGFETFSAAGDIAVTDLQRKYSKASGGGPNIATGRTLGGLCYNVGDVSTGGGVLSTPIIADDDIVVIGFGLKVGDISTISPTQAVVKVFDIDENEKLSVNVTSAGELTITCAGSGHSISGTSSGLGITDDTWIYVEVYALFHASAGQVIVEVDGVEEINTGSVDTVPTSVATNWSFVSFRTFASSVVADGFFLDDIYILDGNGSMNNDILGPQEVRAIFPDADTVDADFTPSTGIDNYAMIDEQTYSESDYVEGVSGNIDIYDYGVLSLNKTVNGIAVLTSARKTQAANALLISKSVSNSIPSDEAARAVRSSFETFLRIIEQNPDGPVPWTKVAIDVAQFGFEVD